MDKLTENPFASPPTAADVDYPTTESSFSRPLLAILLVLAGAPIGAMLCSMGYLAVIVLLEFTFVPPLHSPGNYGQFGFLLIYFGFFGLFFGASFGLLAYTRFSCWLPVFGLTTVITIYADADLPNHFDVTEVTCFAMVVVATLIVLLAWITSYVIRRMERRASVIPRGATVR